jgi:hypothetical protein
MKKLIQSLLSVIVISLYSLPGNATVIWHLNDFIFEDGATAAGQFEWDEASNTILTWEINISPLFVHPATVSPGTYSDTTGSAFAYEPPSTGVTALVFTEGQGSDEWDFRIGLDALDLLDTAVASLMPTDGAARQVSDPMDI